MLLSGALIVGCSDDDGAEEEPCESTADCDDGEVCGDEGVCVEEEGPTLVEDEDYWLSFFARATQDVVDDTFRVLRSDLSVDEEFDTGDVDCTRTRFCGFTDSGDHFVYASQIDGQSSPYYYEVVATPVSGDARELDGSPEVIAENVARPELTAHGVAYERDIDERSTLFALNIGEEEQQLTELHPTNSQSFDWEYDSQLEMLMVWQPVGLDSMDVYAGAVDFEAPADERFEDRLAAILDGTNRGQAGGLFQGGGPMAISPTGRYIAYATGGPNNYESCSDTGSTGECEGTARVCGEEEDDLRCVAVENTVHVVDMEFVDMINEPCTSHDDCGPLNRCDSGAEDLSGGVCAGERFVLGLPPLSQGGQTGCEWTRDDESFGFTHINGPLSFGGDGRIYVVGQRDCEPTAQDPATEVESNIARSSIVAIDLETRTHEEVFGNPDNLDYAPGGCGLLPDVECDDASDCPEAEGNYEYACAADLCRQVPTDPPVVSCSGDGDCPEHSSGCDDGACSDVYCIDDADCPASHGQDCVEGICERTQCVMTVNSAQTSPQGSEVLFTGTNPSTSSPGNAGRRMDIWRMTIADGQVERLGNLSQATDVSFFQTFSGVAPESDESDGE